MKNKTTTALLLGVALATLAGCSGAGFRVRDALPDFDRSKAEWLGIVVDQAREYPSYGRHCIETKSSETSPGSALACSGDPKVVEELYRVPYSDEPGATPTRIRFDYVPTGGNQLKAIGPEIRAEIEKLLQTMITARSNDQLASCRMVLDGMDGLLAGIDQDLVTMSPPDHHGIGRDVRAGREVIEAFWGEYGRPGLPSPTGAACVKTAERILDLVQGAPLTGYLEITDNLSWKR